jgi:teichuronic acid biosynthesis glycosyltransferase TuaC
VIAVSAALAIRVAEVTGVEPWVLPIGCDHVALEQAALPHEEARQRLGIADDQVVVLYVGTLKPEKGVPELADAVRRLGDPFLTLIVGEGPAFGHGADGHAGARVRYLGTHPHDEVPGLMSAADVLVLPSHREGLPTVLVEAGSLGLPVIASPVGGIPELLADERGRILEGASSEEIAAALTGFLADRPEAARRAARLREHVRSEYDVDRNAARLLARYEAMSPGLVESLSEREPVAPRIAAS